MERITFVQIVAAVAEQIFVSVFLCKCMCMELTMSRQFSIKRRWKRPSNFDGELSILDTRRHHHYRCRRHQSV